MKNRPFCDRKNGKTKSRLDRRVGTVAKPLRWVLLDNFGSGLRAGFAVLLRQNRRVTVFFPGACPGQNMDQKSLCRAQTF